MNTIRKLVVLVLVVTLCGTLIAGCTGANTQQETGTATTGAATTKTETEKQEPKEIKEVLYLIPGTNPDDGELMDQKISEAMQQDGLYLKIKHEAIPWDVWEQKLNLMLSTGEPFDLFQTWTGQWQGFAAKGGLLPLDNYLENAPSLKKVIPQIMWDDAKFNGMTYVIPAYWVERSVKAHRIMYRKDVFRKNGLNEVPKTPEELLESFEIIQKNWEASGYTEKPYILMENVADMTSDLYPVFDSFPFTVYERLVMIDQEGNCKSWVESEEFKYCCNHYRKAYVKGLIHPDVLTLPKDWNQDKLNRGQFLMYTGVGLNHWANIKKHNPDMVETDLTTLKYYEEEKPPFRMYGTKNCNVVPSTSRNPEGGVQFLEWMHKNQDNYDLVRYGIKGQHWSLDENGDIIQVKNSQGLPVYERTNWMIANLNYERKPSGVHKEQYYLDTTVRPDTVNSITIGFAFDAGPVMAEYNNCLAEYQSSFLPLEFGVADYNEHFESALKKMKAAGIDKVVAEYERQLKDWLSRKK